jgi:hypothetical protein
MTEMNRKQTPTERQAKKPSRREFFKTAGLGVGAAVAGAAVVSEGRPAGAAVEPKAQPGGYRETPHVRRYYDLARF